jgi:hypothetical protein
MYLAFCHKIAFERKVVHLVQDTYHNIVLLMLDLFHYTDKKGLEGIKHDQRIHATQGTFGHGVYLTTIPPDQPRQHTADEIFGRGGRARYHQGRLDHYVRVRVHSWEDGLAFRRVGSRGHRLWRKYDIFLNRYEWDCGENGSWSIRKRCSVPKGLLFSVGDPLVVGSTRSYSRLVDLATDDIVISLGN